MKFIVQGWREYTDYDADGNYAAICKLPGAYKFVGNVTRHDRRTCKTLDEARKHKYVGKEWFNGGTNHREEKGGVVREVVEHSELFLIDIQGLSALVDLAKKMGGISISSTEIIDYPFEITEPNY